MGYVHCACRDCFDIAIDDASAADDRAGKPGAPALCLLCAEAGCEVWEEGGQASRYGCEREDFGCEEWRANTETPPAAEPIESLGGDWRDDS